MTQFIRNPAHSSDIAFLVAVVLSAVPNGDGIPDQMVVDVPGIEMGADHHLKPPAQQLLCKFQPDLMGQFRGNLPGGKALHQMEPLHPFFLMPHFLDPAHILEGGFHGAAKGRLEQPLFGLVFIEGIVDCPLQRFLIFFAGALFLIEDIVHALVQAVNGNHTGVGHRVAPGRNSRPWFRENNRRLAREQIIFLTNYF